jgi:hypothetical protein
MNNTSWQTTLWGVVAGVIVGVAGCIQAGTLDWQSIATGIALGVGGYLSALRRTESFPFRVDEAKSPMDWVKLFFPSYESVNEHFSDDSVKKVFTKAF